MKKRSALDLIAPVAFVLGLLLIVFAYGVAVGKLQVFPYVYVKDAALAWRALQEALLQDWDVTLAAPAGDQGGARILDPARVAPGLTFLTLYTEAGMEARLIELDGTVRHRWQVHFDDVFPETPHIDWRGDASSIYWHGAHLFPNGDILFNFMGGNFPYAGGLVRLDKDSRIVWKLARNTHHDIAVAEDGTIWVPALRYHREALPQFPDLKPWYYEDTILKVSPAGEVLDEISVLEALKSFPGALSVTYEDARAIEQIDPLHVNNVEPLPAAIAAQFPMFEAGDLLVSMRNANTLAVLDPETRQAKWLLTGRVQRQHDPDFLANGNILVFDNRGQTEDAQQCGFSRIVEIDPLTQNIVWQYRGCSGEFRFATGHRGEQVELPNGNILVSATNQGEVVEITRDAEPRIVWRFVNGLAGEDGAPRRGIVTHASRHRPEDLAFLAP